MSSAASSETPSSLQQQVLKAGLSRWKLEALTGLLGYRALKQHQQETARNLAAENSHVRKQLWGDAGQAAEADAGQTAEADAMEITALGDIHYQAPPPPPQSGRGLGKLLAGLALGTLIPAAGVGGFLASQLLKPPAAQPTVEPTTMTDETVDIGLGRLEDLRHVGDPK